MLQSTLRVEQESGRCCRGLAGNGTPPRQVMGLDFSNENRRDAEATPLGMQRDMQQYAMEPI